MLSRAAAGYLIRVDNKEYVKSVVSGLVIGHICIGFAAVAGFIAVVAVGWTQWEFLVTWVPVILTAVFLVVTTLLLRKDMIAQSKDQPTPKH